MPTSSDPALIPVQQALASNDRQTARQLLVQYIQSNPGNPEAWWLMSSIVEAPAQRRDCLQRVLARDPAHQGARSQLALLEDSPPVSSGPPPAPVGAPLVSSGLAGSAPPSPAFATQPLSSGPRPEEAPAAATVPLPASQFAPPSQISAPAASPDQWPSAAAQGHFSSAAAQGHFSAGSSVPPLSEQPMGQFAGGSSMPSLSGQPQVIMGVPGPYPGLKKRRRPLWIDIPLALLVLLFAAWAIARGLAASGERLHSSLTPPAPTISAQERATGFLNSVYGGMTDPGFYDPDEIGVVLKPVLDEYLAPSVSQEAFVKAFSSGFHSEEFAQEDIDYITDNVDTIIVEDVKFDVLSETATATQLRITTGTMRITLFDGESVEEEIPPFTINFKNVDGIWMIVALL